MRLFEFPRGPLAIEYDLPRLGLFAHLNLIADLARGLGERGCAFSARCYNDAYRGAAPEDWFGRLFVDRQPVTRFRWTLRVCRTARAPIRWRGRGLTIPEARRWFLAKYSVQPALQARVDAFVAAHFSGRVLGVHYRGTDKQREAPRPDYSRVLARIHERLAQGRFDRVFLATDEAAFAAFLQEQAPRPVILQTEALRSVEGGAIHTTRRDDGFRHAEEALMDCLLLSRCAALVKTASALSGWSVVFNPALAVDFINPPHAETCFFPDADILRQVVASSVAMAGDFDRRT